MENEAHEGFERALSFPLVAALAGRRARRFSMGAEIPDGRLAFKSSHPPMPLSELERMAVLTACAGNTGWHFMIARADRYAPHLSNYACAAGGRTFPSAAGFHTSEIFFTDDDGIYLFATRDAPALAERNADGEMDFTSMVEAHRSRIRKLGPGRLVVPPRDPFMDGHNTWCANRPGSLLVIPVADLAQHMLAALCFLAQNGGCLYDDLNGTAIPGIDRYGDLVDLANPLPLSHVEQLSLAEATAECATSCYAGALMLQAMGLGGWMYDGIDRHAILGVTGDAEAPGLGFAFEMRDGWALPNATGLPGVFEAFCPPNFPDMRAAVEALVKRKFGPGGPFDPATPGPWRESAAVRGSARVHDPHFKECVALQAQYILERFGKFPGTVPSVYLLTFLQAHHLDLDFYHAHFEPGAVLDTHEAHMRAWHGSGKL